MIGALVAYLSLDMTRRLFNAGMIASTLTLSGATNATPIVITTTTPHGFQRPFQGVVQGVSGNTAANGLWVCTPTSPTTATLTTYLPSGTASNSIGSGNYVSGGTLSVCFPDGSMLLGARNVAMQMALATPRIVWVPIGSPAWTLDPYGGLPNPAELPRTRASETVEQQYMLLNRQLVTEVQRFDVHVTNAANPPDPDFGDFDATQALYQTLYASMFNLITAPRAKVLGGRWVSQGRDVGKLMVRGQKWIGTIEISQPVVDDPLSFVPNGTIGEITVNFAGGASGDQTIIEVP